MRNARFSDTYCDSATPSPVFSPFQTNLIERSGFVLCHFARKLQISVGSAHNLSKAASGQKEIPSPIITNGSHVSA
jgi:hypothetical protein